MRQMWRCRVPVGVCIAISIVIATAGLSAADDDTAPTACPVWGLAFSPDGKWLAAGGGWSSPNGGEPGWPTNGGPLVVWSTGDWSIRHVHHEPGNAGTLQFMPDGSRLVYRTGGAEVVVVSVPAFEEERRWAAHERRIRGLALMPQGDAIVTGDADGNIAFWETATGERIHTLPPPEPDGALPQLYEEQREIIALAVSPDAQRLMSTTQYGVLRLWNLKSGKLERTYSPTGSFVSSLGFSADGRRFFATTWEIAVRMYDCDRGILLARFQGGGHDGEFSPDGRQVVSAGYNGEVTFFDVPLEADEATQTKVRNAIGRFEDDDVRVREAAADDIRRIGLPAVPLLAGAVSSPMAETRIRARYLIKEVRSPPPQLRFQHHDRTVEEVCFSPDGQLLATADRGGVIKVWRVGDWSEVAVLRIPPSE